MSFLPDRDTNAELHAKLTVEDICNIANSFAELAQYDKAISIYESACKIFSDNLALKINLGRIKNLKKQLVDSPKDFLSSHGEDEVTQSEIVVDRCQGLGEIFIRSGRFQEAQQIFEISKLSQKGSYLPYFNLGKLFLELREFEKAISELELARELNPFEVGILEKLGDAYDQAGKHLLAIETWADGLLILGEGTNNTKGPFRSKISQTTKKIPGFTSQKRNQIIKDRKHYLSGLFHTLQGEIQKLGIELDPIKLGDVPKTQATISIKESDIEQSKPVSFPKIKENQIAPLLQQHLIFRNMDPSDIEKISAYTSEISIHEGDYVYHEGDPIYGLYLIHRGRVESRKETQFGPITYTAFEKGSFFGDDNLMNGRERFTGAVAVQESDLLFIDKAGLAMVFAREKKIAIHFLWFFWKSLSFQIRESNERMKSFFSVSSESAMKKILDKSPPTPTHIEIDKKIEVLQAKGLSPRELSHIARLSNEEIYNKNETIFQEGDMGDRLYIVLEGSVLISKRIPGAGEEALAILSKGDFFGEMSLAGHQHVRSADAKAQEQNTVLLVITRQALKEILSIDVDSAYQFLNILCRILSQRLLEMNEKIYQWRMISGSFQ